MKAKLEKKKDDNINYGFILKCLGALTAAALITAGILAAVATKGGATTVAGVAAAAVVTSPAAPIVGLIALIGAVCLLPLMFVSCASTSVTSGYGGGYRSSWYNTPSPLFFGSLWASGGGHHHHHGHNHYHSTGGNYGGGHVHTHDGGGHVHGHGGGNMHGHR